MMEEYLEGQLLYHTRHLVIASNYIFSGGFSNRWKFDLYNETVDYRCIYNWNPNMINTVYPRLLRIKICTLPAAVQIEELLTNLSNDSFLLEYMEIDKIELTVRNLDVAFPSLLKLSINSVNAAADYRVQFNAPQLRAVYLGKCFSFVFFSGESFT